MTHFQKMQKKSAELFRTRTGSVIVILIFLFLLLIPIIPAYLEVYYPKDNKPLYIDLDYTRDPRYYEKKLLEELTPYMAKPKLLKSNTLKFKDKIPIGSVTNLNSPDFYKEIKILIVNSNAKTGHNNYFYQPLYVKGKAEIGQKTELDVLIANGNINLGSEVMVKSWISSKGDITVGDSSILGLKAVCDGILQMGKGCIFKSLCAKAITSYNSDVLKELAIQPVAELPEENHKSPVHLSDLTWYASKHDISVPPYSVISNSMIIKTNLIISKGSIIKGSVKVHGSVRIEENVRIYGQLISEGDIEIGKNGYVSGNVFSQSRIHILNGVRVGIPEQQKSVIGKKGIILEKNVIVYGYILTEGKGIVT